MAPSTPSGGASSTTPTNQQTIDAGPRGAANLEVMCALSTGKKNTLKFFKGDDDATPIGEHTIYDFAGEKQDVGMVQTWNQCKEMLLTTHDKPDSILLMDTELGAIKSELSVRRQQKNWKLNIESITPMQKFEQYRPNQEYQLFGLGDGGRTVFAMSHDSRAGENVEEFVIGADSHRKYKSYVFTCHAQTKGGYLALGRSDGAIALYDYIMKSENASCVISGRPGPVTSIDVSADGSMIAWTTPDECYFTCPSPGNWEKSTKDPKPLVLRLAVAPADEELLPETADWRPVKFDAATYVDEAGVHEREIISYAGPMQVRWSVKEARRAWDKLAEGEAAPPLCGTCKQVGPVWAHMTVKDDSDVVQLEGEIVKSLRF